MPALTRFVLLYAAMYAAYGVASPFLPAFVSERGLPPEQLGLVLAAGTAVRLLSAPLAGRIGDLMQALRVVLVVCTALAAAVTLGYLPARGFWIFLALTLLHAAALAPMTILAEGTTQAIYATVGIGAATALLTFVSGFLYMQLGAQGFGLLAALCALALPLTYKLRHATSPTGVGP